MSASPQKRFRFEIAISTVFIVLMVLTIGSILTFVYVRNATASSQLADESMVRTSAAAIAHSINFLDNVGDTVDTLAALGDQRPETLRGADFLSVLLRATRNEEQIYSLYVGFESDGAFNEVVRLPRGIPTFGAEKTPVPAGAVYVLRRVQYPKDGKPSDHHTFISADGKVLLEEDAHKVTYDPRKRPFFKQAAEAPGKRAISELYLSASTGKPVLTISRAFGSADGKIAGAVGVNITLDNLSDFLKRNAPGKNGLAMILDSTGQLVAHPDPDKVIRKEGNELVVTKITDLAAPATVSAMAGHQWTGEPSRRVFKASDGREYIASFTPFPAAVGKRWELLNIVPTDDFVGEINRTSRDVILLGVGILIVGVLLIHWVSRAFTRPIDQLIVETEKIKKFDLEGELVLPTRISEVAHLADAMGTMKTALHSFGRFVPKTLVRELVETGKGLGLGGESRRITVFFSDLANFSTLAEKISPQDLTVRVSDYLEDVSSMCLKHHGTIDKYIGDAVMALWNAPLPDEKQIEHACTAALDALDAFNKSNERWSQKGWAPLGMRIGMHTDNAIVGIIGSKEHMSYTALGDGVNIASRLEGINKNYGTTICVSHTIYTAVSDRFLMRPLDYVAVKGRKEPILIYELMGRLVDDAQPPRLVTPEQRELAALTVEAFAAWSAKDHALAQTRYAAVLERFPKDSVAQLYAKKSAEALAQLVPA
jgi:adenylate cyclase